MEILLGKTLTELKTIVAELQLPAFTAKQIAEWIYGKHVSSIDYMTNLSKAAREKLKDGFTIGCTVPAESMKSKDGTVKYLFSTTDGNFVESVYIPTEDRGTLCVSSQVGCKMGCQFCMTGRQGFTAQLTACDIINQIHSLPQIDDLTNVVFMGQGEPFDNLDAVIRATEILTASWGYAWSPKRITVSSVGLKKGLLRFIEESQCHLAISLHNPIDTERETMMPAEKAFHIKEIVDELSKHDFCRNTAYGSPRETSHQRRLTFEYIVFTGMNDTKRHADALIKLLAPLSCRVNFIRFHHIPDSPFLQTTEESINFMCDYLNSHGVTATIRASRGQDIFAACGLLTTAKMENKNKNDKAND